MSVILTTFDAAIAILRTTFFSIAAVLVVVSGVDWLVRTRRVNQFGAVARFMRANVHPLIAPVERRVVRAGGVPSSAPWWALVFVVITGIVLLSLLDFVRGQIGFFIFSVEAGPGAIYRLLVTWTFAILQIALVVRVVLSWIHVTPGRWYVRWSYRLSEPILRPLRHFIPPIAMIDITPIVAWVLLWLLQGFFLRLG